VAAALGWGALAASSLVVGALLALARDWPGWLVGLVLSFGAGALIAAVSYELAQESFDLGDQGITALGLAAGALTFYLADGVISGHGKRGRAGRKASAGAGTALALGAFLDGIPEQLVLGIGIAGGEGVGVGLLVAIFVSNLPEAIGSASDMKTARHRAGRIVLVWSAVAVLCAAATVAGFQLQEIAGAQLRGGINGFAAGALLVMLVGSMIPEATEKAAEKAGLAAVLGFAVAAGLSLAN